MKLRANILTIPRLTVESGREYQREEVERSCRTCDGPYLAACGEAGHKLFRRQDVRCLDKAPIEAKEARRIYRAAHEGLARIGHHCGGSVYLVPREKRTDLDDWIAATRAAVRTFNAGAQVASLDFYVDVAEIDPATSHAEALRSIEERVRRAVDSMLAALASRDAAAIRQVSRETANLSGLLEGQSAGQVGDLHSFAVLTARRLRDAAREGNAAADLAARDALAGAERFRAVFADVFAESGDAASAPAPEVGAPGHQIEIFGSAS